MLQRFRPNTGRADIDRLFQNFFGEFDSPASSFWMYDPSSTKVYSDGVGSVPVDVKEEDDNTIIVVDLPGIDSKDIKVEVSGDLFRLETTASESNEQDSDSYILRERRVGSIRRSIRLHHEVDVDKVTSSHKDGVLEVTLPKLQKSQSKQIIIN
jgi:HSP20 family protein